jgi:hypothetical protein
LKRFVQIFVLSTPIFLLACGSSSSSTDTTAVNFNGTYKGTVTGLNSGPVTFIVSAQNTVSGTFSIVNRVPECSDRGGVCETIVEGSVDAAGNIKGDFVDLGAHTMHFSGKIVGNNITNGSWGEYIHDPVPDGAFTAAR